MSDLAVVASTYLAACEKGDPPTVAVETALGLTRATAGRRIAAARAAGLIPRAANGSSPRMNRKVVAVAKALGVKPERLRGAILRYADGDLRI